MLGVLSRYYTPTLSLENRFRLFRALGLADSDFVFSEYKGPRLLRAKRVGSLPWRAILAEPGTEVPTMRLRHPDASWLHGPLASASLWAEIFPPPLDAFEKLEMAPQSFRASWLRLRKAFAHLESRMGETEVACLSVSSSHEADPFVVFAHFVRGRCQRAGSSPRLVELAHLQESGALTPEILQQWFGTQSGFFTLDLRTREPGVEPLIEAIEALRRESGNVVEFRLSSHAYPEMGL